MLHELGAWAAWHAPSAQVLHPVALHYPTPFFALALQPWHEAHAWTPHACTYKYMCWHVPPPPPSPLQDVIHIT